MIFQKNKQYSVMAMLFFSTLCFAGKSDADKKQFRVVERFKSGSIATNEVGDYRLELNNFGYNSRGSQWLCGQLNIARSVFRAGWLFHGDRDSYHKKYEQLCVYEYRQFQKISAQGLRYKGRLFRYNWLSKGGKPYGFVFYAKSKDECYQKMIQVFGQDMLDELRLVS